MNLTSLPEILRDGAILLDGKEPTTWAVAIERVLVDENLRTALTQRGLAQARRLSWQRCAEETVAVYEAALGRNGHLESETADANFG
jgi:glycosyltransferase involved in cell wall biosynthesis